MGILKILKSITVIIKIGSEHLPMLFHEIFDGPVALLVVGRNVIGVRGHHKRIEACRGIHQALTDILLMKALGLLVGQIDKLVGNLALLDIEFLVG